MSVDYKHVGIILTVTKHCSSSLRATEVLFCLQIPLMMTVYLMVSFKDFVKPPPGDPANSLKFYNVPANYTEGKLKDIFGGKGSAFSDEDDEEMVEYM